MSTLDIPEEITEAIKSFQAPEDLGFGRTLAPVMFVADYEDGLWSEGRILPYGPLVLSPAAKVLHYGQEIFEGMKAYKVGQERTSLFRPDQNLLRINRSAERMAMPAVSETLFYQGVFSVTACCDPIIPQQSGQSLYLRPFMIATEPSLDVSTSSRYSFMVLASPSEAIHRGSMKVLIERGLTRAAVGGTGAAKTGGNYAASFASREQARQEGFDQSLWLDAADRRYVEELSVMNFFAVVGDELHTPALAGSLLSGITRDSLIQLANGLGITVRQHRIDIDALIGQIKSGDCSEVFCCGTAAIISAISLLGEHDGRRYPLSCQEGDLSLRLKEALLAIQEGRSDDVFGWMVPVPDDFL